MISSTQSAILFIDNFVSTLSLKLCHPVAAGWHFSFLRLLHLLEFFQAYQFLILSQTVYQVAVDGQTVTTLVQPELSDPFAAYFDISPVSQNFQALESPLYIIRTMA